MFAKNFIRNVIVQAVERGFMEGVRKIFDSKKAAMKKHMSDEMVTKIASENEETRQSRIRLSTQARELRGALFMIGSVSDQVDLPPVSGRTLREPASRRPLTFCH